MDLKIAVGLTSKFLRTFACIRLSLSDSWNTLIITNIMCIQCGPLPHEQLCNNNTTNIIRDNNTVHFA